MRISIGIDVAKEVHWATAVAADGGVRLDRKVENTADDVAALTREPAAPGGERGVGIDMPGGVATPLTAMLLAAGEHVVQVPGLTVNLARQGTVGGRANSDPKDARVIADQLRLRSDDFRPVGLGDDALAELRLLVGRRGDLVVDQTRRIGRMRYLLATIHPSLERGLDLTTQGALHLIARFVTAIEIRRAGRARLIKPLRAAAVRQPERLAETALAAARAHPDLSLPAEAATADLVRELAAEALACKTRIAKARPAPRGARRAPP